MKIFPIAACFVYYNKRDNLGQNNIFGFKILTQKRLSKPELHALNCTQVNGDDVFKGLYRQFNSCVKFSKPIIKIS